MTYATVEEFKTHVQNSEFAELINVDEESEEYSTERVTDALQNGASEIDQILAKRYQLPFTVTIPYLRWGNIVIARKNLFSYDESSKVRADYDDLIKRLEAIAEDDSDLVDENGNPVKDKDDILSKGRYVSSMYSGSSKATVPEF